MQGSGGLNGLRIQELSRLNSIPIKGLGKGHELFRKIFCMGCSAVGMELN